MLCSLQALPLLRLVSSPLPALSNVSSPSAVSYCRRLSPSAVSYFRRLLLSQHSPIVFVSSPIHSSLEASDCSHLFCLGSSVSLLHSPCKATTILGFQQHYYSTQRQQLIIRNFSS